MPSLVEQFRHFRVTLVSGELGDPTTELLKSHVLPALGRRAADRRPAQASALQGDFIRERRTNADRGAEIPIYCDTWNESTLETLGTRVAGAIIMRGMRIEPPLPSLADAILQWGQSLGARFLFVLDRFEHCVAPAEEHPGLQAFLDELVRMAREPLSPVHFLIAVPQYAEPMLEPLCDRIPGVGTRCVRLAGISPPPTIPNVVVPVQDIVLPDIELPTSSPPLPGLPSGPEPMAMVDMTSAPLEQTLPESQTFVSPPPAQHSAEEPSLAPDPIEREMPLAEAAPIGPVRALPTPPVQQGDLSEENDTSVVPAARTLRSARWRRAGFATLAAGVAAVAWTWWSRVDAPAWRTTTTPSATVETAAVSPSAASGSTVALHAAPPPPVRPDATHVRIAVDPDSTNRAIVGDLARVLAPDIALDIDGSPDAVARTGKDAALAFVTFETIRPPHGARTPAGSAHDAFRILLPLYTEEIHVVARADSPFTFIHELRDARINFGPPGTGRRLTAARLYERMFGSTVPDDAGALDDVDALHKLVVDRTVDAVVVIEAQPSRRLAALPPELARSIKLLALDREHPASQAAIEDYLPVKLQAAGYPGLLAQDSMSLATMAFLVAPAPADAAAADQLTLVLRALCRQLPLLRSEGHPKWREIQPLLTLEGGWELWPPSQAVFQSCLGDDAIRTVAANPAQPHTGAER